MLNKFVMVRLEVTYNHFDVGLVLGQFQTHSVNAVSADLLQAYAGKIDRSEARGNHFRRHTSLILTMQPLSIPNIISFITDVKIIFLHSSPKISTFVLH